MDHAQDLLKEHIAATRLYIDKVRNLPTSHMHNQSSRPIDYLTPYDHTTCLAAARRNLARLEAALRILEELE